ncbi:hypothetical protein F3J38_25195 [Pantoea sp. Acro-805]|uniref:Putative tail fiber protein gp53-like C-terminal domain-containing protein n=1 Tax=Candidatus Pantoea formicae TaxID=2608355 RepID=A0ABX0R257_9GAMM|nr:hypothetical protein [Pantoea formicae]NIF03305.1 hypothetical protein [Pantoea formicae]
MPAGTITLTSGSTAVTGTGTNFATELKVNDLMVAVVGGVTYTLGVQAIGSATALTLTTAFNGPTSSGLAWTALPNAALVGITAQVAADVAKAIRGFNFDKVNWQKIFSSDASVTVTLPDLTKFTGPSWGYLMSQFKDFQESIDSKANKSDLGNSSSRNVGTASGTVAAGDDTRITGALQKSGGAMTGAIAMGGNPITGAGQLAFSSTTNARQTLINMGVVGNASFIRIPFSTTQAYQIICATAVQTQNSSGDSTLTFPIAFSGITSVVVSNGDGAVGNLNMNVLNALRTSGFDCRVYNNGGAQTGAVRINYIATGVVNI